MAKTKIVVIQLKEIIYTVIFAALGILLILLLIFMFRGGKDKEEASKDANLYKAGKYTSTISLGEMSFNLEVDLDKDHINAVTIQNLDEAITTMYPLVAPSLEAIQLQLQNDVPFEQLELDDDKQFTEQLLIDAIAAELDKAKLPK